MIKQREKGQDHAGFGLLLLQGEHSVLREDLKRDNRCCSSQQHIGRVVLSPHVVCPVIVTFPLFCHFDLLQLFSPSRPYPPLRFMQRQNVAFLYPTENDNFHNRSRTNNTYALQEVYCALFVRFQYNAT